MQQLLALLPLLLFVVLLVGLRFSAASAGALSAALAIGVAVYAFGYPVGAVSLAGPSLEALFTSAAILWIIFPALGIYEYQTRTGAIDEIRSWLSSVSSKPQIAAILVAWFFGLFLEGAAGFGTPVALVAPMLVAFGLPPLKALIMALFGHAAGVAFGAVGTPIVPLMEAASADVNALSLSIVLLHAALGWILLLLVFGMARPTEATERAPTVWVPVAGALFFAPAAALAWFAGPELPTLGAALVGGLLFVVLLRLRGAGAGGGSVSRLLLVAALPYLLVFLLILATRLIPPLAALLRDAEVTWQLNEQFGGPVAPLYHPGTMLFVALVASAAASSRRDGALRASLLAAAKRIPPVALALVAVLLLARIMIHSGMIEALALSASGQLTATWLLVTPLVGALGSFVTGSATASNIILAEFQATTAAAAGIAPLLVLAGQGFGAAIGNIIAPHNIVAGAATVGLVGREGEVLKRTLPVCLVYALLGGVLLLVADQVI